MINFHGRFRHIDELHISASVSNIHLVHLPVVESVLTASLGLFQHDFVNALQSFAEKSPRSDRIPFDVPEVAQVGDHGLIDIVVKGRANVGRNNKERLLQMIGTEVHHLGVDIEWRIRRLLESGATAVPGLAEAIGYDLDSVFDVVDPERLRRACAAITEPDTRDWPM